jgi:hypothetical protein
METFLYWSVYLVAALTAGYHSFMVYRLSDPWIIALGGAISIDGLASYAMFAVKNWTGNQRLAGFIGIGMFAFVSGAAQIISRYHSLGVPLPEWLAWVSMGLVPLSTVGAVITLGIINSFRRGDAKQESPLESLQATIRTLADKVEQSFSRPSPVVDWEKELEEQTKAELPKLTTSYAAEAPAIPEQKKRGPGRPPKARPIGG